MNPRLFYMIAEVEHNADGRVIPRRCISGPYAEYLMARQVKNVLGDDYHVCEYDRAPVIHDVEVQP